MKSFSVSIDIPWKSILIILMGIKLAIALLPSRFWEISFFDLFKPEKLIKVFFLNAYTPICLLNFFISFSQSGIGDLEKKIALLFLS